MTVRVVGHWELGWNSPIKEVEQWELVLREFNVFDWWMWPVSGVRVHEHDVNLYERQTLGEILDEVAGTRIFVEPRNLAFPETVDSTWLADLEHPADAVYIFGSAHFNPIATGHRQHGDLQVSIETIRNNGVLWPHQCLLCILRDRILKEA